MQTSEQVAAGILGIGIDLVEIVRMEESLSKWHAAFKDRLFTADEQAYCDDKALPARHYAARFAVKEAVSKAFGTGIGATMGWRDIEVQRDPDTGRPSVRLTARVQAWADAQGAGDMLISLSHTRDYALAQALILRRAAT